MAPMHQSKSKEDKARSSESQIVAKLTHDTGKTKLRKIPLMNAAMKRMMLIFQNEEPVFLRMALSSINAWQMQIMTAKIVA